MPNGKDYTKHSDHSLILLLREKEPEVSEAFNEIYERYSNRIYVYCLKIIGQRDKAEDCLQETLIRFLNYVRKGGDIRSLTGFLIKTARNVCLDLIQTQKHELVEVDEVHIQFFDNRLEQNELAEMISQSMKLLSPDQKEAFILQNYQGMCYDEIAEVMDAPVTSVRNWLRRAKIKMKQTLTPYLERN